MSHLPHVFETYQHLLSLSQNMLRLANDGEWDALIATEVDYVSAVEKLAVVTQNNLMSDRTLQQIRPVLRHLIDNETEVKRLLQQRQDELSRLIAGSTTQRNVLHAYGNLSGQLLMPHDNN
ncbi:flagellar protein FliT [Erwinia toletana]|uniref:Flagellar protein FliT n=1 Tax=Winslowiella toletana TaxID=92490 RepID=A0ABS4P3D7_9GAMM|nr:flagella biosynthesis regulatory protein FliT [Winslowiella toletana]MBP2167139.1 flagellar protein FliT [Winslowiella toletana]